jgi:hypothetical protein
MWQRGARFAAVLATAVALVGVGPAEATGISGANGVIDAGLTISPKVPTAVGECNSLSITGAGLGEIHIAGSTATELFAAFGGAFTFNISGASTLCETVQLGTGTVRIYGCQSLLAGVMAPDLTLNPPLACDLTGNYTRVGTKVIATLTGTFSAGSHTWYIGPLLPMVVEADLIVTNTGSPSMAQLVGKFWNTTVTG